MEEERRDITSCKKTTRDWKSLFEKEEVNMVKGKLMKKIGILLLGVFTFIGLFGSP